MWLLPPASRPDPPETDRLAAAHARALLEGLSHLDLSDLAYLGLQYEFRMQSDWHAEIATTVDVALRKNGDRFRADFSLAKPWGVNWTGKIGLFFKRLFKDEDYQRMLAGIQTRLTEELSLQGDKFQPHRFVRQNQSAENLSLNIDRELIHIVWRGKTEGNCPPIANTGQETPLAGFFNYCFFDEVLTEKHIVSMLKKSDDATTACDLKSKTLPIRRMDGPYRYAILLQGYSFLNLVHGSHIYFNLATVDRMKIPCTVYLKGLKSQTRQAENRDRIRLIKQQTSDPDELERQLRPLMLAAWNVRGRLRSAEYRAEPARLSAVGSSP